MDIAPPPKAPRSLRNWLLNLVQKMKTLDLEQGKGISIKKIEGKGATIMTTGPEIPDAPPSGTFVLVAVNGAMVWVGTTSC